MIIFVLSLSYFFLLRRCTGAREHLAPTRVTRSFGKVASRRIFGSACELARKNWRFYSGHGQKKYFVHLLVSLLIVKDDRTQDTSWPGS